MSASWPGSMRGPRVKTPLLLLLLLLLLSSLTRTVLCQYDDAGTDPDAGTEVEETDDIDPGDGDTETSDPPPVDSDATSAPDPPPTDEGVSDETAIEEEHGSGQGHSFSEPFETTEDPNSTDPTSIPLDDEALSPVIILIPVVLVVVIIGMIVCGIFINRRWNKKTRDQELRKADPYLDGSSTEKVPMPMFEEDVPSVLELEMEELDQWMKKDGESADDPKHA